MLFFVISTQGSSYVSVVQSALELEFTNEKTSQEQENASHSHVLLGASSSLSKIDSPWHKSLIDYLKQKRYQLTIVNSEKSAFDALSLYPFTCILLDLEMISDVDAFCN